ncbi:hypothetical protein [Paenibacillus sp. ISL-20]|uniref:hypothetical protein n=1 Tax=Paenibacillus sp. ISL-20 TaxID=2819163 RepID=UPI0020353B61|nr:hypothetical protein [Paenibacillus sp. ISL-20]
MSLPQAFFDKSCCGKHKPSAEEKGMISLLNNEKILVCVYYGPNGERLIRRGGELAKLLQCPLFVLSVIPLREDELDQAQERYMAEWQMKCDEYGATFIVKTNENRKASEIIAETAKNHYYPTHHRAIRTNAMARNYARLVCQRTPKPDRRNGFAHCSGSKDG